MFTKRYIQGILCRRVFSSCAQFIFFSITYFAPCKTVLLSVAYLEESNVAVICTSQTVSVDKSSPTIVYTFPVKCTSPGTLIAFSFSALSVTSLPLYYSLIVH